VSFAGIKRQRRDTDH